MSFRSSCVLLDCFLPTSTTSLLLLFLLLELICLVSMCPSQDEQQDPIGLVPNEIFSHLLSHLPPSSLAQSNAVSHEWRTSILSNPTLHQIMDLSNLSGRKDSHRVIYHFIRLSSLSLHRIANLSLNLTPFFQNLGQDEQNQIPTRLEVLVINEQDARFPSWVVIPSTAKVALVYPHSNLPSISELSIYYIFHWENISGRCPILQSLPF